MAETKGREADGDEDDDEWECAEEDGFVFKRRKRDAPIPSPSSSSSNLEQQRRAQQMNLQFLKQKRRLQKDHLVSLKNELSQELAGWESLLEFLRTPQPSQSLSSSQPSSSSVQVSIPKSDREALKTSISQLLFKVEVQNAVLKDLDNLCKASELECEIQEKELQKSIFDIPVWRSPSTIMDTLCPSSDLEDT